MKGLRVDHIAIAVDDLSTAIEYFSRRLGFSLEEKRTTQGETTGMLSAVLKREDVTFVLLQGEGDKSQVSRFIARYGPGVHHVALRTEGLTALVDDLKNRGVEFSTGIVGSSALRQIFTERSDNSRLMIELIERSGNSGFEDSNVSDLFRDLERSEKL
jgi:methylmalonyl-CoA epimerase